jgi:glycosyltransferase involved in cell wall biosynthesis
MEQVTLKAETKGQAQGGSRPEKPVELSVVIPISERHDDLRELYLRYAQELSATGHAYEFIFVLDGPEHEALQTLKALKKKDPEITIIMLNRWFGEATALSVAFDAARGPMILTLGSSFQVEPHEVHRLLKKLVEDDQDLVMARRFPHSNSRFNRVQSWLFNWLVRMLTGTSYHDISCGVRAMKRTVAEELSLYGDLHRFFPLLAYQRGFSVAEVPVQQSPQDTKRRVYAPGVYLRRLLDVITLFFLFKFAKKPLRFFGLGGSGLFGAGAVITGYLGLYRLLGLGAIAGRPLLILGALLMVFGIQLFSIGLLGEIIIFTHARDVKEYQIRAILE